MELEFINNRENLIKNMNLTSEKEPENNKTFIDKVEAGTKAVANKINNPGTDLNLEYEKEKAKDDTKYISKGQSTLSENNSISNQIFHLLERFL